MRYTTIVDKSEETLIMIIGKAEEFDQERVLNGLDMRHYTQEEVRMLTFEDIDSQEKDQLFCSHTLYFDRRCLTKQKEKNNQ